MHANGLCPPKSCAAVVIRSRPIRDEYIFVTQIRSYYIIPKRIEYYWIYACFVSLQWKSHGVLSLFFSFSLSLTCVMSEYLPAEYSDTATQKKAIIPIVFVSRPLPLKLKIPRIIKPIRVINTLAICFFFSLYICVCGHDSLSYCAWKRLTILKYVYIVL